MYLVVAGNVKWFHVEFHILQISAKMSIIDFTVTIKGLEDQLLGRVIMKEKQELEAERVTLIEDVTANKRKMKELEDNLLHKLTSTQVIIDKLFAHLQS